MVEKIIATKGKKKQQQQKNKELTYQDIVNEDTLSFMYEN